MKIGFIGAGKVGKAMGLYFKNAGIDITGYYSRTYNSAIEGAQNTNSKNYYDMESIIKGSDIIAITTPDDVIAEIVNNLAEIAIIWHNKTILHMSGVNSSEILEPLSNKGATVLSLHPMLSFTNNPFTTSTDLKKAIFTIEGTGQHYYKFKALLDKIEITIIEINTEDKVMYHAAASIISNYTVTLLDIGKRLFHDIGFSEDQALKLTEPLIRKTVNNVIDFGTEQALTGPISRGDVGTVVKHIDKLVNHNQAITEIYKILGLETTELAFRGEKINEETVMKLKEVLANGEKGDYCNI